MAIFVKYKGVDLRFETRPSAAEIHSAYLAATGPQLARRPAQAHGPLSLAQQQIWFHEQSDPGTPTYNVPVALRFEGALDLGRLLEVMGELVRRHEVLRSRVVTVDGGPAMAIDEAVELSCPIVDLSALPEARRATALTERIAALAELPLSLSRAPLLHSSLYKEAERSHVLALVFHHLVTDAQSMANFLAELLELYDARQSGREPALPALELSFGDLVRWQEERLAQGRLEPHRKALLERFSGELPTLDLFADFPRSSEASFQGGFAERRLDAELVARVRGVASELRCTPYMVALAAVAVVLSRYTGQTDLIIGTPFAGRTEAALQPLMGLFVQMRPIRIDLSAAPTLAALLTQVRDRVFEATAHQDYPLLPLLGDLAMERQAGRSPLFQTILSYGQASGSLKLPGFMVTELDLLPTSAKFEISFMYTDAGEHAKLEADFRKDLFSAATIETMLGHVARVLEHMSAAPQTAIEDVPLLSAAERRAMIRDANQAEAPVPPVSAVHQLVEQWAANRPEHPAVIHGEASLSYGELNRQANQIARWLRSQGMERNRLAVLLFDQGVSVVVAMLAVLKSGGAYLPLDPGEPAERLRSIVADSGASIALCQASYASIAAAAGLRPLVVDWQGAGNAELEALSSENLDVTTASDDWMNVLYTSGSTGTPKGVLLPHRGVLRLVHRPNFVDLRDDDRALQLCPLNFDGATFEIWSMLCNGGSLVIAEKSVVLSPADLGALVTAHGVTALILTTPLLNRLIEDAPEALRGLRHIVFGGEIISKPHMTRALEYCQPGALVHTYGPTENSFTSCHHRIREVRADAWTIPIGTPVSGTEIYVLDDKLAPVPLGVVGEIYLSGQGLAHGYLGDPEKTARSFVANPFEHGASTARMYRTGDRGRRRGDGLLEFVGRTDDQVKIRSQRVELGEVEAALRKHPLVAECFATTVLDNDGAKQLVAYLVPLASAAPGACHVVTLMPEAVESLREALRQLLPDYMIPTHFVALTALPLNPNGKVNRRMLPRPELDHTARRIVGTEGEIERAIAEIWREVLGLAEVSTTDNFFEIGGHSLSLVRVQRGIETALGVKVPIVDFFQHPTIRALALVVSRLLGRSAAPALAASTASSDRPVARVRVEEEAIAIIGMAIRAPKAEGIDAFWNNLKHGRNCITHFSEEEVAPSTRRLFEDAGPAWVRAGGLLDDVYGFDPAFFGMTELEARRTDPQQRLLLECVADAMENAGLDLVGRGASVSLYVGATPSTYGVADGTTVSGSESLVSEALANSVFMATRISYRLNLKGESVMVDTLCSTSLVAVHMACTALLSRSSDYALAGGVTVTTPQKMGYLYEPNFILSPDGLCRTFDKDGNGTVPGNGAGIVMLRRLSDALRDGDPIHAVIRGSAVNNDGNDKIGYYAPGVQGQAAAIATAQRVARVSPDSISYIEAHGTATKLGDPIEISALTEVFRASTSRVGFCGIGSVKTNIGHLGNGAGVAGLIKATLALKHRFIPASLHYREPNPNIDFARSPFYVTAEGQPWRAGSTPRRAGVSSYGIGGTNAHVILEELS
jgi:amino acid adenylation domain-containing protein